MFPQLQFALDQIVFARGYTVKLLDATPTADWFRMLPGGVTHIGWQVGHLAMAEYRLLLERVRGRVPSDQNLISELFLLQFGRDSTAEPDPAKNPSAEELRHVFDVVHQQALHELPQLTDEDLQQPPLKPHPLFNIKMGGLWWCGQHEMMHAGQIGLLRRQLAHAPLW
jgi:hypothetical protein